ncbi:hypothetical protein ACTI_66000 [Actinoplanes sp. OR16]|nr:hypothetical protein ACTI_66000 [Actinoplanes sp. OR16]
MTGPATSTAPPAQPANGPDPIRFGLCGAAGGGKTTFLASLHIAVGDANQRPGERWTMTAADEASLNFMVDREQDLIVKRTFPVPTSAGTPLHWRIDGTLPPEPGRRGLLRRSQVPTPVSFSIDVEDQPGAVFLLDSSAVFQMSEKSLDRLANAQALMFLFDPMLEIGRAQAENSNWLYFNKLIQTLKMRLWHQNRLVDGRLPHHVAVCVTKFDNPAVFLPAFHARLIDIDENGIPRVPGDLAEEYFDWICDQIDRQAVDSSTEQFKHLLRSELLDGHVHYFGTSSVGFWTDPSGQFSIDDFQNFERVDGEWRLRGRIRPVNVLEPLIAIERTIRLGGR